MNFLIQTVNGEVVHDFCFELIQSLKFLEWNGIDYNKKLSDNPIRPDSQHWVPVGSLEFVHSYMKNYYGVEFVQSNVPLELMSPEFSGRSMINYNFYNRKDVESFLEKKKKLFIKPFHFDKGMDYLTIKPDYSFLFQASELVDMESEWRVFFFNDKLLDVRNYFGDPFIFPDKNSIVTLFNTWKSKPVSGSFDVFVNDRGTFIVEAHNFYSTGLYGFTNKDLPYMFIRWFNQNIQNAK